MILNGERVDLRGERLDLKGEKMIHTKVHQDPKAKAKEIGEVNQKIEKTLKFQKIRRVIKQMEFLISILFSQK